MKRTVSGVALAILIGACGRTGGVADTPPAPVAVTTTAAPSVATVPSANVTEAPDIDEADISELESVLDEVEDLVADTEMLIDEALP